MEKSKQPATTDSSSPKYKRIPLSEPVISGNEWKYVKECLDTGWVSSAGKFVDQFALAVKDCVGSAHAVPTSSGTAGLHVALLALGLLPNEEVLVPLEHRCRKNSHPHG